MIVETGLLDLQKNDLAYLEALEWGLFTANLAITATTVLADVTASEAGWTGYERAESTPWQTPAIIAGGSQTGTTSLLTFSNGSGGSVTFYGWFAVNPTTGALVAALNIGLQTIPSTGVYSFAAALNDANTGP